MANEKFINSPKLIFSSQGLQLQPGYGPYDGSDEAAALEKAFGTDGIAKQADGAYDNPVCLKFMTRYLDSNSQLHCNEYIYLGGTINDTTKAITNPRYIKLSRKLKTETALAKAAGEVNTTSDKVYPVVVDSQGNLSVVVPWTAYSNATTSAAGLMSSTDKSKLNGIATGAQVNQNAFSNIKVGDVTIAADTTTDTLELVAGANITLTPNSTDDKVVIAASLPAEFIEVVEDGLYNIDANYTVEPTGSVIVGGGGSSSNPDLSDLTARVAALETVLGNTSNKSITFNLIEE